MSSTHAATPLGFTRVRRLFGTALALAALLATSVAFAQSSSARTITVPFGSPGGGDGYESASARVTYAFIACMGELHITYSLDEGSASIGSAYRFEGKRYPVSGSPPQLNSIDFIGTVYRGPSAIGHFSDGFAGKALGMGCFSGQTRKIALIADYLGPRPTAAQVGAFLDSLTVQVRPGEVLRSSLQESMIRSELRRAEAEATAAARRAEQEAQALAQREAEQRAAAERAAQAQQMAQASGQASYAPAAGSGVPTMPAQPTAPVLSREERIARAIASDKVLADQRAEQQRAEFARQQAALAAQQQQQAQAMIAATPAVLELAGSVYGALEAWDARVKERRYNAAQIKLAGLCQLPNGMAAPRDGDIRLGVDMVVPMGKDDCGRNPGDRYKAFKLELTEPMRLRFTVGPSKWRIFTSFQVDVRDLANKSHMFLGWQEWGAFQKVNNKSVSLPAGVYIVTVSNGVQDIFYGFDLRVDPVDQDGNVVAMAPPAN